MNETPDLPVYNALKSYQWNYDNSPEPVVVEVPEVPGNWTFCGLPALSPLGIPAGPLLNGRWVLYYASLGFDVLTYKTVRSSQRACYDLPNLAPIRPGLSLTGAEPSVAAVEVMQDSWAVSFGMPSTKPATWQADVTQTKASLPDGKILCVSVVGTAQRGWSIAELADDYAQCARWAAESGADVVEVNFSCPNVATQDGQLYQKPDAAGLVAGRVHEALGGTPLCIKIGHVANRSDAAALLDAVGPHTTGLAMTNCIATTVRGTDNEPLFDGNRRGIAGSAILDASVAQVAMFAELIRERDVPLRVIGVGGASTAGGIRRYLDAGAESIQIATAAMLDPLVGCRIRREL